MFNKVERLISSRNLRPKKKEGFLKLISIFSFLGIMLGVAILIIVMSVMNGFRTDLTNKILGLNPHIVIESNGQIITKQYKSKILNKYKKIKLTHSYTGEGVAISQNSTKGVLIKGIKKDEIKYYNFLKEKLIEGNINNFNKNNIYIGAELAYNLDLSLGETINLMSSSFVSTPMGKLPKQENFKIAGIFRSGFAEFDNNVVILDLFDALSLFDKSEKNLNIELYLDKPLESEIYKNEILNINNNFFIYTWADLNKSFFSALKVERNVMFIILTMIIIVAAFNIISGLTILIKNKTREIAILKTLGLSTTSIKKIFFLTGMTIGFFATLSGLVIGVFFSIYIEELRILLSNIFNLNIFPADVYFLDKMPSELNLLSVFIVFISSIIITGISSYFPAKIISKMETTKALKYE